MSGHETREHFERLAATATRDEHTGEITVNLDVLRAGLVPYLLEFHSDRPPAFFEVYVYGKPVQRAPIQGGPPTILVPGGPRNGQPYVHVALLDNSGKGVHMTEPHLFEGKSPPIFKLRQTSSVSGGAPGVDFRLPQTAGQMLQTKGNWYIQPQSKNEPLHRAFEKHGSDLDVTVITDASGTHVVGVEVYQPGPDGGKVRVEAAPEDFFFTLNADFSKHFFDWDSKVTARAARFTAPMQALGTLDVGLASQQKSGAVWRELDSYLNSYQMPYVYKFGKLVLNREAFNPPLLGWMFRDLARWDPTAGQKYLPRVLEFIEKQRIWLENEPDLVVKDANGKILGFRWTALGSGRDNAFRGELFVDLITYYKMLLDQESELRLMSGDNVGAARTRKWASDIAETINKHYWNEKVGGYVDLVPADHGPLAADGKRYGPDSTLNATSFFPAMANVAGPERLTQLIRNLHSSNRFGGRFIASLAPEDPRASQIGNYWRGGGWPPDWAFVLDMLSRNELPAEARREAQRMVSAMTEASDAFKLGHSPQYFVDNKLPAHVEKVLKDPAVLAALRKHPGALEQYRRGKLPNNMGELLKDRDLRAALAKFRDFDTVWETYGEWTDSKGNKFVAWGKEVRTDGSLHVTRGGDPANLGFVGWGSMVLEAIRSGHGFDGSPRFTAERGRDSQEDWLLHLMRGEDTGQKYEGLGREGPLKPFADYLRERPAASLDEFRAFFRKARNAQIDAELDRLDSSHWLYQQLTNPAFKYHNAGANPHFRPLALLVTKTSGLSFAEFDQQLQTLRTAELWSEMEKAKVGHVTIAPTYDPSKNKTFLDGISYDGMRYRVQIDRLDPAGNRIQVTVDSERPFLIQFHRHWRGTGAAAQPSNEPLAASSLVKVGGKDARTVEITLQPAE